MNTPLAVNSRPDYLGEQELRVMDKRTWLRLSEAAERENVPVTAETLRRMILDGRVPEGYYDKRPYGEKHLYWIAEEILDKLNYKDVGKPPRN